MPRGRTGRDRRLARHRRTRAKVNGTAQRPRLSVYRSLKHVYAQLIDDERGETLASASSLDKDIRSQANGSVKREVSRLVGSLIARRGIERGVAAVVFDRGGYKYHGRVKALSEAARKEGLVF